MGTWWFLAVVTLIGIGLICFGWYKSGKGLLRTMIAAVFAAVLVCAAATMTMMPVNVGDATCMNTADPYGVTHADVSQGEEIEVKKGDPGYSRFECRDILRGRYLGMIGGYLGASAVVVGVLVLTRRRP